MERISWLSSALKTSLTRSSFEPRVWRAVYEKLDFPPSPLSLTLAGAMGSYFGSHWSLSITTLSPIPILHRKPALIIFLPSNMLLQVQDGFEPALAVRKEPFEKYLALRILCRRQRPPFSSHHPCLAKRAKLKQRRSRKPRPPPPFFFAQFIPQ